MQTFQLSTTSRLHYTLILLTGIFSSPVFVIGLVPKDTNYFIIMVIIVGLSFFAFWLAKKYSKQLLELSISQEYLRIDWMKLPLFSNKQNRQIAWTEIDNYVYQTEKDFNLFKLTLKDGKKLKFSIAHDFEHLESFHEFFQCFLSKIDALQEQQTTGNAITIKQGKTFYETPVGIGLAFLLGGMIVVAIIFALLNQDKRPVKWGKLIGCIFACLFYIQLVWSHNRKKKKSA